MSNSASDAAAEIRKEVSCWDCVNAMFYCVGPAHQFDRYYKDGKFDGCAKKVNELLLCMKLKTVASPQDTKEFVRQMLSADQSPTENVVWKPRSR